MSKAMPESEKQWKYTDQEALSSDATSSWEPFRIEGASIQQPRTKWVLCASIALNVFLGAMISVSWFGPSWTARQRPRLYSPANPADETKDIVFETGFWNTDSPYIGRPSGESDRNWSHLYDFYLSRLTAEEARPLENWTLPTPGDEKHYAVQFSVFHELHCLDQIRHALWDPGSTLGDDLHLKMPHLDHCIQVLRQSIQCHSDITPMPLARDPVSKGAKWVMATKHTCRNFEKIRDWASQRTLVGGLDYTTIVKGDPLGWGERVLYGYQFAENTTRF